MSRDPAVPISTLTEWLSEIKRTGSILDKIHLKALDFFIRMLHVEIRAYAKLHADQKPWGYTDAHGNAISLESKERMDAHYKQAKRPSPYAAYTISLFATPEAPKEVEGGDRGN